MLIASHSLISGMAVLDHVKSLLAGVSHAAQPPAAPKPVGQEEEIDGQEGSIDRAGAHLVVNVISEPLRMDIANMKNYEFSRAQLFQLPAVV